MSRDGDSSREPAHTAEAGHGALPMPSTAWVVLGASGQYSDWRQWPVCVCLDEQMAKDRVGSMSSAMRTLWATQPQCSDFQDMRKWDAYQKRRDKWEARITALDPGADGYDETHYTAAEIPLIWPADGASSRPPLNASQVPGMNHSEPKP